MEKLIELLNEYEKSITEIPVYWGQTNGMFQYGSYIQQVSVMYMISKHYGFIKRLVENDKIDRPKAWLKIKDLGDEYGWFGIYSGIHIECLLMLLAISDTPIDDLISYLK